MTTDLVAEASAMPIHDWTRVPAGIFHHFHGRWIAAICDALNEGLLPGDYYALAEQVAGDSEAKFHGDERPERVGNGFSR